MYELSDTQMALVAEHWQTIGAESHGVDLWAGREWMAPLWVTAEQCAEYEYTGHMLDQQVARRVAEAVAVLAYGPEWRAEGNVAHKLGGPVDTTPDQRYTPSSMSQAVQTRKAEALRLTPVCADCKRSDVEVHEGGLCDSCEQQRSYDAVSAEQPGEGERVRLLHDVDRYPHFIARAGSHGTVVESNADIFTVRLDEHLPGAEEWSNEVVWSVFDGDVPSRDVERI